MPLVEDTGRKGASVDMRVSPCCGYMVFPPPDCYSTVFPVHIAVEGPARPRAKRCMNIIISVQITASLRGIHILPDKVLPTKGGGSILYCVKEAARPQRLKGLLDLILLRR